VYVNPARYGHAHFGAKGIERSARRAGGLAREPAPVSDDLPISNQITTKAAARQCDESSIRVLKGLEPVKQRPGMYTRTENPLHIVQEVLDIAVDETIGGFARNIGLELLPDGVVRVSDDGRGIPAGMHPEENAPVVELGFTRCTLAASSTRPPAAPAASRAPFTAWSSA
jgi:hypothetical protein